MASLTVLLLGSGGREHALAWTISRSPRCGRLICAPGNPGMEALGTLLPLPVDDGLAVLGAVREHKVDLVVVGPEAPLAAGVADALREAGVPVFGPSRAAARLEWEKAFAKEFMDRYGIPTAAHRTFDAESVEAGLEWLGSLSAPYVLKASGLAGGKGVVIAETLDEATEALREMLDGSRFGEAGAAVVIEEYMAGEEASIFALCDGERYVVLPPAQDHKRLGDGDTGPNTGGMGAYAPAPVVTTEILEQVAREVIEPTLAGMRAEGTSYIGCLYVGLMIEAGRARVVEFNCRFGDPETQVVLPLLDEDLLDLLDGAARGSLPATRAARWSGAAACIVMASKGYPGAVERGRTIEGIESAEAQGGLVFHAGTAMQSGELVTAGGRVLGVVAVDRDGSLSGAVEQAYTAMGEIRFDGATVRNDIGARAVGSRISAR